MKEYILGRTLSHRAGETGCRAWLLSALGPSTILAAGILNGVLCVFVKQLSALGMSPSQITAARMIISALVFAVYTALFHPEDFRIRPDDLWMFIGTGIAGFTLFSTFYMKAVLLSGAATAVVLIYTAPIIVTITSVFLFGERLTKMKVVSVLITFIGCILVSGLIGSSNGVSVPGILFGLGAGMSYALYSLLGKLITKKYSSVTMSAYTFLFAAIGSIPAGNIPGIIFLMRRNSSVIFWSVGIALACGVLSYFAYNTGVKYMEVSRAAVLSTIEPVVGALIGIFVYQEPHGPGKILGIAMILWASVIVSIRKRT